MTAVAVGLAVPIGSEAATKCWAMARLELTLHDGKPASAGGEGLGGSVVFIDWGEGG